LSFSRFAPAKVNLYLHVTGKRADGYHLLDSLAVFPATGDVVAAEPADELSLAITGPFGAILEAEADNLLLRAARLLGPTRGAALRLEKNLPVASGIGGGSADAAAALRVLCALWGIEDADLRALALQLGADVPVCLASRPARMQGIGEVLAVFRARQGEFSAAADLPDGWADVDAMVAALAALGNDLQAAAIDIAPVIGEALAALAVLPGAKLARMSGSGATCFAIFATPKAAHEAAAQIGRPSWWHWGGGLYQPHR